MHAASLHGRHTESELLLSSCSGELCNLQGKKRKAADGYAGEGKAEQLADLLVHLQGLPVFLPFPHAILGVECASAITLSALRLQAPHCLLSFGT